MKRNKKRSRWMIVLAMLLMAVSVSVAVTGYRIPWWSVDGGGSVSRGGVFAVSGVIGQPDVMVLRGGAYVLEGGFLGGAGAPAYVVGVQRWWEHEGTPVGNGR